MMVGSRLCFCVDRDRTGPKPLRSGTRCRHGGEALHAGSLRGIRIELAGPDDPHAVVAPSGIHVAHGFEFTPSRSTRTQLLHQAVGELQFVIERGDPDSLVPAVSAAV